MTIPQTFTPEWEKEMMKWTKPLLIDFIKKIISEENEKEIAILYKKVNDLEYENITQRQEIERLKEEIRDLKHLDEEGNFDPYWYWPQCDVDGCEGVSCRGGGVWEETGYWSVCSKHSDDFRKGLPQPKMKDTAIEREKSRDKDGILPTPKS